MLIDHFIYKLLPRLSNLKYTIGNSSRQRVKETLWKLTTLTAPREGGEMSSLGAIAQATSKEETEALGKEILHAATSVRLELSTTSEKIKQLQRILADVQEGLSKAEQSVCEIQSIEDPVKFLAAVLGEDILPKGVEFPDLPRCDGTQALLQALADLVCQQQHTLDNEGINYFTFDRNGPISLGGRPIRPKYWGSGSYYSEPFAQEAPCPSLWARCQSFDSHLPGKFQPWPIQVGPSHVVRGMPVVAAAKPTPPEGMVISESGLPTGGIVPKREELDISEIDKRPPRQNLTTSGPFGVRPPTE